MPVNTLSTPAVLATSFASNSINAPSQAATPSVASRVTKPENTQATLPTVTMVYKEGNVKSTTIVSNATADLAPSYENKATEIPNAEKN